MFSKGIPPKSPSFSYRNYSTLPRLHGNQLNPLDSQNAHLHDETFTTHDIFLRRVLEHLRPDEHIILSWFFGWGGEASSSRYDLKALSYQQLGHGSWNPWYPFQPWQEAQRRPQPEWVALRGPNKSACIYHRWWLVFFTVEPWGVPKGGYGKRWKSRWKTRRFHRWGDYLGSWWALCYTPRKINMEPENDGFQKESPLPGVYFFLQTSMIQELHIWCGISMMYIGILENTGNEWKWHRNKKYHWAKEARFDSLDFLTLRQSFRMCCSQGSMALPFCRFWSITEMPLWCSSMIEILEIMVSQMNRTCFLCFNCLSTLAWSKWCLHWNLLWEKRHGFDSDASRLLIWMRTRRHNYHSMWLLTRHSMWYML